MRTFLSIYLLLLLVSLTASAATSFQATTTLAAETANNTSAAAGFTTQTDGNIAPGNVSKVPVRSLLYPGATGKIYAQFLPWFGFGDHINVGYISTDIVEVQKQVDDMASRGIDGAIIDWYGTGASNSHFVSYDQASQELMHQAEQHPGFTFAIQHDAVALKNCGCDVTQTLISDLNYAVRTYLGSSAYLRYNGRPVFFFFGHEAYPIDWNTVRSSVGGNPLFIFRNAVGFGYAQTDGAFSWVEPATPGFTYLDNYYATALTHPSAYSIGSAYKGFNDSLAAWGTGRLISQQCGQTFLQSMAEAGKYYSASKQLLGIQMVTWNDYEEGTELETGIDNCVTVAASASGSVVSWSISGQMNTIDHFSVFISQDSQSLMWLADEGTNVASLDLAQFGLPAGNYVAYVKAVGKPMMTNKMSPAVSLGIGGSTPPPSSGFTITAPAGSATVKAGQTATYALQLSAIGTAFSVTIGCSGAPTDAACNVSPAAVTVTPGTPDAINVSVPTVAHAVTQPDFRLQMPPPTIWLLLLIVLMSLVGQNMPMRRSRRGMAKPVVASLLVLAAALATGCGGTSAAKNAPPTSTPTPSPAPSPTPTVTGTPAGTYTLVVTAVSGGITHTQPLTLTVQ